MAVAERRVRRVRLAAADEQLVRRGALLLEDALRTMTAPGGGRPLFIRRLVLEEIRGEESAAALALQIEAQLGRLASSACYALSPEAGQAPAVFFQDTVEPAEQLALRLVRGQPVDGWFWPVAVPGWRPQQPLAQALRQMVRQLLQNEAGPAAVARLVVTLQQQASVGPLLAALAPADGPALLQAFGWAPHSQSPATPLPAARLSLAWMETLTPWVGRWGAGDARLLWVTGIALASTAWHQLAAPTLPARMQAAVAMLADEGALVRDAPLSHGTSSREPITRLPGEPEPVGPVLAPDEPASRPVAAAGEAARARDAAEEAEPAVELTVEPQLPDKRLLAVTEPTPFEPRQPTDLGGLFFLVPVLARLGMADFLEAHPALAEAALPWQLLRLAGEQVGAGEVDAIWDALPPLPPLPNLPFTTPARWRQGIWQGEEVVVCRAHRSRQRRLLLDRGGQLPLATWQGRAPAAVHQLCSGRRLWRGEALELSQPLVLTAWLTAVARWLGQVARKGLREVVLRPASLAITPTHLDLFFDHRQAEVAIRRAGLDLDPGWVPWLGRVVGFHYRYGEQL